MKGMIRAVHHLLASRCAPQFKSTSSWQAYILAAQEIFLTGVKIALLLDCAGNRDGQNAKGLSAETYHSRMRYYYRIPKTTMVVGL